LKKEEGVHVPIRESVARTIAISVVYAILEAYYVNLTYGGDLISPYHVLVFLVGLITGFDKNLKIWIANFLLYSVLEDAFYWVSKFQLPSQWGLEYIVIDHIPIYYIPYSLVAIILYVKGLREEIEKERDFPSP
jgi:hypothetical protein